MSFFVSLGGIACGFALLPILLITVCIILKRSKASSQHISVHKEIGEQHPAYVEQELKKKAFRGIKTKLKNNKSFFIIIKYKKEKVEI